ncbi:hypothetical protein Bca101_088646 [Brassica carinata]
MKHAEDDQPTPLIEPAMVSEQPAHESDSDSDDDESDYLSRKPIGPVDPSKSTASGATACVPSTVKVTPGVGVGGEEQEGVVKDVGDGSYAVTYFVPKRAKSLSGRCANTMCKLSHPPQSLLMTAIAATTSMSNLSQVPMAPSAAAMAAAQAIVAAQTLQAHMQAQARSNKGPLGSPEKEVKGEALKKYLQVGNLSPQLTTEQLKQHFSFCGTVVDCSTTDSKLLAYIEYSKPEEATAALALNNMEVCGRALNVEIAKSLPQKPSLDNSSSSSLPMMMQQAVAMQQMQFQQAILMQQAMATQQAANKAATMKSATELAAARAAEISRKLNPNGVGNDEKEADQKPRSPSNSPARKSKQDDSELSRHRRDSSSRGDKKSSRAGSRSPRRHKETKSTARDDEETKHRRRTRSRSRTVEDSADNKDETREEELNIAKNGQGQDLVKVGKEPETHPEVLMILNGNTGGGPGLNHWKSSRRNELKEDKGHRITEKEVQVRISGRHRRERRSSPGYSDENKSSSRRKGHSRSREKRDSSREKRSKRHERLRSASPEDYNGRGDRPSPVSSE